MSVLFTLIQAFNCQSTFFDGWIGIVTIIKRKYNKKTIFSITYNCAR